MVTEKIEEQKVEEEKATRQHRHDLGEKLKDPDLTEEEKEKIHAEIAQMDREPRRENPTEKMHREHDEREKKIDEMIGEKEESKK